MIRRAIGTTLAGLCALTGPLAGGAFAATTDPALSSSTSAARPGVAFTVTPTAAAAGCPSDSGVQTVELTFTDRLGTAHWIGSTETADDGSWTSAAELPVAGLDADGSWSEAPVAPGVGTLSAVCTSSEDSADDSADDPADDSADDSGADDGSDDGSNDGTEDGADDGVEDGSDDSVDDPADDGSTEPGDDDTGDPDSGDSSELVTRTYPGITFTATGTAAKLALSTSALKPGDSVTVTPAEGCATGTTAVTVALVSLSDSSDDGSGEEDGNAGDDGTDNGTDDGTDDGTGTGTDDGTDDGTDAPAALPTVVLPTTATGTWSATTLVVPADAATGDYFVSADCTAGDLLISSYDAEPIAVGTVLVSAATCTAKGATVALTGSYGGELAGKEDLTLPAKLTLAGDGPWKINVRSATTGQLLASRTVVCAKPQYDLDLAKNGLSDSNKARARVCNTGRAPVTAVLQVLGSKKYQKVDKEILDPGQCTWLQGPKLGKGDRVKAQVLVDAPGKGSDEVVASFTVKRGRH